MFVQFHPILVELNVLQDLRGSLIVVPETGTQCKLFVAIDFVSSVEDVKDTSPVPPGATSYP